MNRPALLTSLLLAATMLAAGCGSVAGQATAPARSAAPPSLATSLTTPAGTWAVAVMGGSAASHNNFWQLFVRPAGTSTWRLATPPGVASNGGLVLTGLRGGSMMAGFRPSQRLGYSPLATTKDNGKSWSPSLLDAGLADIPGALAADPASGRLLALLTNGSTEMSGSGGTAWTRLTTRHALATSPAGTRCELESLTATAFSPSGRPMLAAGCAHPGTAGIFSRTGRTWQLTGPALPAAYAHQAITVLQAHDHRRNHHGSARRRNWVNGTPAGRLVHRWRRALETVAATGVERRHADIGVVRARQQPGDHPEPPSRSDHRQRRGLLAAAASAAPRHCDARTEPIRRMERPGCPRHPAHHLAGRRRRPILGERPGHQGSRSIRLIRLMAPQDTGTAWHQVNRNDRE